MAQKVEFEMDLHRDDASMCKSYQTVNSDDRKYMVTANSVFVWTGIMFVLLLNMWQQ